MLGAAAALGDGSLLVIALSSFLAMLAVSVHRGWQYVLVRQRQRYAERMEQQWQRYAERMAEKAPPGIELEFGDGETFFRIRNGLGADQHGPAPEGEGELADAAVVPLSVRRQDSLAIPAVGELSPPSRRAEGRGGAGP